MKKFKFSLENVLRYREQMLDTIRAEHAVILAKVRNQEDVLNALERTFDDVNTEFRQRKMEGMSVADAMGFNVMLRAQQRKIENAIIVLDKLKKEEEAKREQVRMAKTDKATIDKIKEKKLKEYNKDVQKKEEQFIDEFVSTMRVMAAQ